VARSRKHGVMVAMRMRAKAASWSLSWGSGGQGRCHLLASLLALGALLGVVATTAMATCSISYYPNTSNQGGSNPAEPDIPRCYKANPINCATGNRSETQIDLAVRGGGPPLRMARTYNSQRVASQGSPGPLGYGWTGSYSAKIDFGYGNANATITHDNGSTIAFTLDGGQWRGPEWTQAKFVHVSGRYIYTEPNHKKLEFDSNGRLLKITDRHGLSLTLSYNSSGQLASVTDHPTLGRALTFTYNGSGQIATVTDPMGRVASYTYSGGNLISVTLPGMSSARWTFAYNGSRLMTHKTNGRGRTTITTYDSSQRATNQTDPLGRQHTFVYDQVDGVKRTTITKPNGAVEVMKFNEAGSPTSVTVGAGTSLAATTTYTHNDAFLVTSETDPKGHTTTYAYDGRGNKLSEEDPNGNETTWTYNSTNDVIGRTSPKGQVTTFTRNAVGDPTNVTRTYGGLVSEDKYEYNAAGDMVKHTDPVGRVLLYLYDPIGRGLRLAAYSGAPATTANQTGKWEYNLNGEVTKEVSGRGFESGNTEAAFTTTITRDAQGRPTTITDPLGGTTTTAHDANGNIVSVTDGRGNVTSRTYDAADQLIEVERPGGLATTTTFNTLGQVASRTNAAGGTRSFKHDVLGRVIEITDPLGRDTLKSYDAAGNLKKTTDAKGRTIDYAYDSGDRPTGIAYSDPATADVTLSYDANDNLTQMVDGTGTTTRAYDALDRVTQVTSGANQVVKYEYNAAGDVTKITYPNGKAVTQAYDSVGRLAGVTDWLGKETTFEYHRDSQQKATIFPTETTNVDEYAYDARGDMTSVSMKKGASVLASLSYTRDAIGQITKTTQTGIAGEPAETIYAYDAANRLTKSNGTLFDYDLASNVKKIGPALYGYDVAGQISSASNATYVFDELGQRTKSTPSGGVATTYAYDQAGNLTSVTRPASGSTAAATSTFKYDGSGLRTSETKNSSTYPIVYDSVSELPLLLRKGQDYFVYGPGGLPVSQITADSPRYLHHDQLGSTRVLTNSSGNVVGTYYYGPNGAYWNHTGTHGTQIGFAGEYRMHTDNQLIYLRARTYDPVTAQFLSVDPLVDVSDEPYSYAGNNPVNAVDPTGLIPAPVGCMPLPDCCTTPNYWNFSNPFRALPHTETDTPEWLDDVVIEAAALGISRLVPQIGGLTLAGSVLTSMRRTATAASIDMAGKALLGKGPTLKDTHDAGVRALVFEGARGAYTSTQGPVIRPSSWRQEVAWFLGEKLFGMWQMGR
jgi:RHS repeat-associated protein